MDRVRKPNVSEISKMFWTEYTLKPVEVNFRNIMMYSSTTNEYFCGTPLNPTPLSPVPTM
jgi:hypothetical protein